MKPKLLLFLLLCCLSYTPGVAQDFNDYQKTWASYFGGSGIQFFYSAADSEGNLIAAGQLAYLTFTNNDADYYNQFVTSEDPNFQYHPDTFFQTVIAKFSPDGDLLWSGYYPFDIHSFAIDDSDNVYIAGSTEDSTLGTPGTWEETPLDTLEDHPGIFIMVKLNPDFTIDWLSYLPFNSYILMDIGITGVFVTGITSVEQGITTDGVFQSDFMSPGSNGYIVKLNLEGQLDWGTYTGITGNQAISYSKNGLAVFSSKSEEGNDDYYVTDDAYQQTPSSRILSIFDPISGQRLYGTYIDSQLGVTSIGFANGFYYLFGQIINTLTDPNLISDNAFQTTVEDSYNYYLGKFDAQFNPVWGTYIGGDQPELIYLSNFGALSIKDGGIYLTAPSQSGNFFDSPNPYQLTNNGEKDLLVMKFSTDGELTWCSFFGGEGNEDAGSIVPLSDDTFYLLGSTASYSDISTPGSYQEELNKHPNGSEFFEYSNGFVAKFSPETMSVREVDQKDITIYPNPTDGKVFISGNFSGKNSIKIHNILGQEVFSKTIKQPNGVSLNVQSLPPGVYFLELINPENKNRIVKKLIVN